ncbi:MAG: glycosyltransferase [Candidatus Eremiobacteraeota bacterium]|nr:glycosyltransferase [Candidatus Eremiobacteraeota bacterium]
MFDLVIESLFTLSVGLIWFMIAYQLLLSFTGYLYALTARKDREKIDRLHREGKFTYPFISIMVPAHNEEKVIEKTVRDILALDYPADKMELLVINDSSTDRTGELLEKLRESEPRLRILHTTPDIGGRGKSRALNLGMKEVKGDLIAIYDADNRPEKNALRYLAATMELRPGLGAALGMFRCINRGANLLTRFINIEGIGFQWIVQAGRWKLMRLSTLPGTNFVVRRELMEELGGWDEDALTEDSELSIRIYQKGMRIAFIPYSVTWEQEPQSMKIWYKQRRRWVRGNNYVLWKFLKELPRFRSKALALELLYTLSLYYIFLLAVIFSDLVFILGVTGIWNISLLGPFSLVWALGYLLFILEVFLTLSFEGEDSLSHLFLIALSYFTYCQAWIVVVISAIWQDITGVKRTWIKTERVSENQEAGEEDKRHKAANR